MKKINVAEVKKSLHYQEKYTQLLTDFSRTLNRDLDWAERKLVEVAAFKYGVYQIELEKLKSGFSVFKNGSEFFEHHLRQLQSHLDASPGRSERVAKS